MEETKTRVEALRQELKQWEKRFPTQPTREQIKNNPPIALKYKEYQSLREQLSGKSIQASKKRNHQEFAASTTCGARRITTPQKSRILSPHTAASPEDSKENVTPVALRTFVDPTPQKDGRVLGLFDLMLEEDPSPISKATTDIRRPLSTNNGNAVISTPCRLTRSKDLGRPEDRYIEGTPTTANKYSRTPQSSSKRFLLDTFLTPSKRRRLDDAATPSSKQHATESTTPAFLTRNVIALTRIEEEDHDTIIASPSRLRLFQPHRKLSGKRTGLTRSLSSMIAEMRQAEEERLDEEMDLLREIEEDSMGVRPWPVKATQPQILVEDSQILGPDGAGSPSEDDSNERDGIGRDGQPLKVWKKKGQKRTTRRVILRPQTRQKAVDTTALEAHQSKSAEKTHDSSTVTPDMNDNDDQSDTDFDNVDANLSEDEEEQSPSKKRKVDPTIQTESEDKNGKQTALRRIAKKISATANANFCRLKIRGSKGAKAATAGRGRFGKRR